MKLEDSTQLCRLFADGTRLRLLLLLEQQALSVAELTRITELAQSRVSTHLGKLREAGLVTDQRHGTAVRYQLQASNASDSTRELWQTLRQHLDESEVKRDSERMQEILRNRDQNMTWADTVAGRMKNQYSPGRTWEATTRALLQLLELGDVLDIASGDGLLAELLTEHAKSVTCVDISEAVIQAGERQLGKHPHIMFKYGDMHELPFENASFDTAFLMHALTYTEKPQLVIKEAARILRPGGQLILATLNQHDHQATVAEYDHVNLGYTVPQLKKLLNKSGMEVAECNRSLREPRAPYFEVITARARKP
ncbi:MAG: metalloregulator ArsR/SmtB family transcription factor [Salinisphaeraceae bacterium]|nr:metalloregulator ArsR/SmtB family transcription factor [Salinisphaeraceae bacterium]